MNRDEIFAFLNEHSAAVVATSENNIPHLRTVWTVRSDTSGILFHTGTMKEMYHHLVNNPNVEMCFLNPDKSVQIRVSGIVRQLDDPAIKLELLEKRPFLKDIKGKTGSFDFLSVFLLEKCKAVVWTFATNMNPKTYIDLHG
jgi:pyridoxamine 5'-phosphate oxidase